MTMLKRIVLVLALIPGGLRAQAPQGPFAFADPKVRIALGAQDGTGDILLRSSVDQPRAPSLSDFELPHPPAAVVTFELVKDNKPQANSWRFRVRVSGLSPANTMQQHYAVIEYDEEKTQLIPYFLTNQPAVAFAWNISKPPDPWVDSGWLPASSCTALTVTPSRLLKNCVERANSFPGCTTFVL